MRAVPMRQQKGSSSLSVAMLRTYTSPIISGVRVISVRQQLQHPASNHHLHPQLLLDSYLLFERVFRCRFRRRLFVNTSRTSMNGVVVPSPLTPQSFSSMASARTDGGREVGGLPDRGVRNIHHKRRASISRRAHHLSAIVVVTKHRDCWRVIRLIDQAALDPASPTSSHRLAGPHTTRHLYTMSDRHRGCHEYTPAQVPGAVVCAGQCR